MRLLGRIAILSPLLGGLFGCVQTPTGARLCPDPQNRCDCQGGGDASRGAVVVRWRLADAQIGRLLPRGECCCIPDAQAVAGLAGQQCTNFGSRCPDSPAWLVRNVQLKITALDGGFGPCVITAPCSSAELSTEYCLPEGEYELQLNADIEVLDRSCREFACSGSKTAAPAVFRRTITAGRATSLDGVVLGVNPPALPAAPKGDGGVAACTSANDGGTAGE